MHTCNLECTFQHVHLCQRKYCTNVCIYVCMYACAYACIYTHEVKGYYCFCWMHALVVSMVGPMLLRPVLHSRRALCGLLLLDAFIFIVITTTGLIVKYTITPELDQGPSIRVVPLLEFLAFMSMSTCKVCGRCSSAISTRCPTLEPHLRSPQPQTQNPEVRNPKSLPKGLGFGEFKGLRFGV